MAWEHKLTGIDIENRTATCEMDGVVKIIYNGKNKYGQGFYRCNVAKNAGIRAFKYKKKYGIEGIPVGTTCEICGGAIRIAYDHDHQTGKFRGWLCMKCNIALGLVNDDIELLKKMIAYLQK